MSTFPLSLPTPRSPVLLRSFFVTPHVLCPASMNLFLWILAVDLLAVLCGVVLLWRYKTLASRARASAAPRALPDTHSETQCEHGAPAKFRKQACALNFRSFHRSRVFIPGDVAISGTDELTVNVVLGLHEPAPGIAGVLCDVDGVFSLVASGRRVGFRVCQIAPLQSDPYAWSHELVLGRWYLVTAVFSHGAMTVYVDGVASSKSAVVNAATHYCGPVRDMQIGANESGVFADQYFDGAVAHIELWTRAFSRMEVANLQLASHKMCVEGEEEELDDLAVLYSMETMDDMFVCDESGNGHHGQMGPQPPEWVLIECSPSSLSAASKKERRPSPPPPVLCATAKSSGVKQRRRPALEPDAPHASLHTAARSSAASS